MANAVDIMSLAEGKAALNIAAADTTFDSEVAMYITAASQAIDRLCGPVINRTVTAEAHNGGGRSIWLLYTPVASISSVAEYDNTTATTLTAETNTTKTANNYLVDLGTGRIRRRQSNYDHYFPVGAGNVIVTYTAGRGTSADDRFKLACALVIGNMWRTEQGAGSATFGGAVEPIFGATFFVPNKVREMLVDDLKAPMVG